MVTLALLAPGSIWTSPALAVTPAGSGTIATTPATDPAVPCDRQAQPATCLLRLTLPGDAGHLPWYVSRLPGREAAGPSAALVVIHGYPRDAAHSFNAGLAAASAAGQGETTLIAAPLFQVEALEARRCDTPGEVPAQPGDALWRCGGWLAGDDSLGGRPVSAFAALDALIAELPRQWPTLQTITIAGFSAGAQFLQRHAAFGAPAPAGLRLRRVIADPGTWLYLDPVRPRPVLDGQPVSDPAACGPAAAFPDRCVLVLEQPAVAACRDYDQWKYGLGGLPAPLGVDADTARERYRQADLAYLAGALDSGPGPGTFNGILDHSCAAELQGPFRLQRAQGFAAYEAQVLKPPRPRPLAVVPGCAHDVGCVLPSGAARPVLFE